MTEHDGLTALQEAERRYPTPEYHQVFMPTVTIDGIRRELRRAFRGGAEWATEREKARAETYHAAYREALAGAEQANLRAREAGERAEAAEARVAELERALSALVDKILGPDEGAEAWDELIDLADAGMRALTTPTTAAVTEVEGS